MAGTSAGAVAIQGCAIRIGRLTADGSVAATASGMIQDDRPFLKFTAKPNMDAGVELTPKSACGALLIAYKDYDRAKRWDVTLDLGDVDFEKMELLGGGDLVAAGTSAGRTLADGVTVSGDATLTSALGAFAAQDVGRTATGTGIPAGAYITHINSTTSVELSAPATAAGTGVSVVLGAIAAHTVAYRAPQLLIPSAPYGVSLEIWQKAMVRGTGFQGVTPYPHTGTAVAPILTSSAYVRWGWFRCILAPSDIGSVEDKESSQMYTGWAIENPSFATGPVHDWTTTAVAGSGVAIDTTRVFNAMMDFQLPTPLQPGYQTVS